MKDCRKYEELLARHLHGGLILPDRELLERHLSVCPDCERLYGDVSDVDRLLRDLPGKQVDPPPWLHGRVLGNLPATRPAWGWGKRGRWVLAFGSAAAAILAALILFRNGFSPEVRLASAPPAPNGAAPSVPSSPGGSLNAGGTGPAGPVLRPAPGASRKRAEESVVAPAPGVRVIREVKIYFYYPPARTVAVTGDFNGWDIEGVPMRAAGKPGFWTTELRLPPGAYSYNFIVDGDTLLPDPNAPNQMPDGYGGTNSLLTVSGEKAI